MHIRRQTDRLFGHPMYARKAIEKSQFKGVNRVCRIFYCHPFMCVYMKAEQAVAARRPLILIHFFANFDLYTTTILLYLDDSALCCRHTNCTIYMQNNSLASIFHPCVYVSMSLFSCFSKIKCAYHTLWNVPVMMLNF